MDFTYHIEGGNFSRAGIASSEVKRVLKQLNVGAGVVKRVVVALYEAEVNVVAHAYEGEVRVTIGPGEVKVVVEDRGPGIADIELAMKAGHEEELRRTDGGVGGGPGNESDNGNAFLGGGARHGDVLSRVEGGPQGLRGLHALHEPVPDRGDTGGGRAGEN